METSSIHQSPGNSTYVSVWGTLVGLTVAEVILAYQHVPATAMLFLLLSLSIGKAGLIMAYFMHLRFERLSLTFSLIPALVAGIGLLLIFFPDGFRLVEMSR